MKREFLQNLKVGEESLPKKVIDAIIMEILRGIFPTLPTNSLTVIVPTIATGLSIAYAAMFGFDKFKEAFEKLKNYMT